VRVWLIGENNPYGPDPRFALYCEPPHSAGGRLRRLVLAMTERDYLRSFERRNLLSQDRWSVPAARKAAADLRAQMTEDDRVILFGRRVFDAWTAPLGWKWRPFEAYLMDPLSREQILALPHPSGLSRAWNEEGAFARARLVVGGFAPHLVSLLGKEGVVA
jgi:hypothetical protein